MQGRRDRRESVVHELQGWPVCRFWPAPFAKRRHPVRFRIGLELGEDGEVGWRGGA